MSLKKQTPVVTPTLGRETSANMDSNEGHYHHGCTRLRHNRCFQIFMFLLLLVLDGADLITDWLFYNDVSKTEEGLVYGPPIPELQYSLLAFSIIGSFTFIFEVANIGKEIFTENGWVNSDLMSAITIWIEDVPQIIINIFIAACREEAISYFQLVKASVVLFGVVVRILISLVRYCNKKKLKEVTDHTPRSCRHVTYRAFIMIGLIILCAGSITVFIFTQTEHEDGNLKFRVPTTILDPEYNDQKYFHNVSTYFSNPIFNLQGPIKDKDWIRLATIYDVREYPQGEIIKFQLDNSTAWTKLVVWQTGVNGTLLAEDCYSRNRQTGTITPGVNCMQFLANNASSTAFLFRFEFIKARNPGLIFGDIKYNVKVKDENGKCKSPTSEITVHYYRTTEGESHNLIRRSGTNTAEFYNSNHLIDVSSVWKTGFAYCESSGSLAPHHDTSLDVPCL